MIDEYDYVTTPLSTKKREEGEGVMLQVRSSSSSSSGSSSCNACTKDAYIDPKEMRVAIVTACWWKLDGVALTLRKLVRHFKREGIRYRIYTTDACKPKDGTVDEEETTFIVRSLNVPFWETSQGYKIGEKMETCMRDDLEAFAPHIVHVTVPDIVGRDTIYWAKKRNIPLVATWHSNYADYMFHILPHYLIALFVSTCLRLYLINVYTQVDCTFVPTNFIRKKMLNEGFEIEDVNKLAVWGRGVDPDAFSPGRASNDFRRRHGISPNAIVVLWVSRVVREKGTDTWLECIERLARWEEEEGQHRDIVGLVVGTGTEVPKLKRSSRVKSIGWVYSEDLGEVYASSDIFLFPSSVETFGNVTLEAMACGLPVVVDKDCSGHLVDSGVNGFGVESGDVDAYFEAAKKLVKNPKLRKKMGIAAREKAASFRNDSLAKQMIRNYRDQIAVSKARSGPPSSRGLFLNTFDVIVWIGTIVFFFLLGAVRTLAKVKCFDAKFPWLDSKYNNHLSCSMRSANDRQSSPHEFVLNCICMECVARPVRGECGIGEGYYYGQSKKKTTRTTRHIPRELLVKTLDDDDDDDDVSICEAMDRDLKAYRKIDRKDTKDGYANELEDTTTKDRKHEDTIERGNNSESNKDREYEIMNEKGDDCGSSLSGFDDRESITTPIERDVAESPVSHTPHVQSATEKVQDTLLEPKPRIIVLMEAGIERAQREATKYERIIWGGRMRSKTMRMKAKAGHHLDNYLSNSIELTTNLPTATSGHLNEEIQTVELTPVREWIQYARLRHVVKATIRVGKRWIEEASGKAREAKSKYEDYRDAVEAKNTAATKKAEEASLGWMAKVDEGDKDALRDPRVAIDKFMPRFEDIRKMFERYLTKTGAWYEEIGDGTRYPHNDSRGTRLSKDPGQVTMYNMMMGLSKNGCSKNSVVGPVSDLIQHAGKRDAERQTVTALKKCRETLKIAKTIKSDLYDSIASLMTLSIFREVRNKRVAEKDLGYSKEAKDLGILTSILCRLWPDMYGFVMARLICECPHFGMLTVATAKLKKSSLQDLNIAVATWSLPETKAWGYKRHVISNSRERNHHPLNDRNFAKGCYASFYAGFLVGLVELKSSRHSRSLRHELGDLQNDLKKNGESFCVDDDALCGNFYEKNKALLPCGLFQAWRFIAFWTSQIGNGKTDNVPDSVPDILQTFISVVHKAMSLVYRRQYDRAIKTLKKNVDEKIDKKYCGLKIFLAKVTRG
eukprot:g3641.t1